MTDKQYALAKKKEIKFYEIWMDNRGNLRCKLVPSEKIEHEWILQSWVNSCNIWDANKHCDCRYVSADKFEMQVDRYFREIQKDYQLQINHLQKQLDKLNRQIVRVRIHWSDYIKKVKDESSSNS